MSALKADRVDADSPAVRLEMALHPWVAFGVMPLFALANAGVGIGGLALGEPLAASIAGGIVLGLVVGKPLGIAAAVALAVWLGLCRLPEGVKPGGIAVIGCLGGIGFTMSIFIADLAFAGAPDLAVAKFGVLVASLVSAIAGILLGRLLLRPRQT